MAQSASQLIDSINDFVKNPSNLENDNTRLALQRAAGELGAAARKEGDVIHRLMSSGLMLSMTVIGVNTGLFKIMSEEKGSTFSSKSLAKKTGVDPLLIARLLRYYQAYFLVDQLDDDVWSANKSTEDMAKDMNASALKAYHGYQGRCYQEFPQLLERTKYANPTDPNQTAFHAVFKTDLPVFVYLSQKPEALHLFMGLMAMHRHGLPGSFDTFSFAEYAGTTSPDTPIFVDVGGAGGHQCVEFRAKYPDIPGRVILQDQPPVVEQAEGALPVGIEAMAHDFFTPQPIKGARAYYMRTILHDWPDESAVKILENIRTAMDEKSIILIDDIVMKENRPEPRAVEYDLTMAACLAGLERTRNQWEKLVDAAGLVIQTIHKYVEETGDSLIVVVLK